MAFNYYYDFEDCTQIDLTGNPINYVVGSNYVLNEGEYYTIFNVSSPNQRVCGVNLTASTSTAATYYTEAIYEYSSCTTCLSAITNIISVSGLTPLSSGNTLTLVADSRYIKGDIIHIDIVYDSSGDLVFINTPALITGISGYTETGWTVPNIIEYVPYKSFKQVIESKGVYYLISDCSGGTESIILSKQELLYQNAVINLPYGNSPCKVILTALTEGNYSDISGVTTVLNSSVIYSKCDQCLSSLESAVVDDEFEQNTYDALTISELKQLTDGSIVVGGSELQTVDNGDLFNFGNILKLNQDGSPNLTFNPNSQGSLNLNGSTFIYSDYSEDFNLTGNFSIEFWFKLGNHGTDGGIISFKDGDDNGWEIRFEGDDNFITFDYNGNLLTSTTELNANEWYNIAVVNDCGTDNLIMYINGSDDVTTGCTSGLTASTETIFKVGVNKSLNSYVSGLITNVRIVNGDDNFAYDGTFTPQTSPLRNRQNGYGNVRSISPSEVVLLLNFEDKYRTLFDTSVYKKPFYVKNPSVLKIAEKCRCVRFRNTNTTVQNLTWQKCFEPGFGQNSLVTVPILPGETLPYTCVQQGMLYPSNVNYPGIIVEGGILSDGNCVQISNTEFLCPGRCNCYSVKNNTSDIIELQYYDCNRDLISDIFIAPNDPEILVCSLYFIPSNLTIVDQNYQCSATTQTYPFGWQCAPPVDPRCAPIYVDYCYNQFAPNNNGTQPGPITVWYSTGLLGNTQLNLNLPSTITVNHNVGARYQIDITHTLSYTTNMGRLWILHTNSNSYVSTVAAPYLIDEWFLFFTQGVGFTVTYNRRITIGAALMTGTINWGPGSGMAARDNTTLIVSRYSQVSSTFATPTSIVQLNIAVGDNITLTTAQVTTLFSLPANGSVITLNDAPIDGINNPINISSKIVVSGGMTLTDNNRLIIKCKLGANPSGNVDQILLQYTLAGTLEHARRLDPIGLTGPINSAVFSYDNRVLIQSTAGANPVGWSVLRYNGTPTAMTTSLSNQTVPLLFPGQYTLTGPMGASSPRRVSIANACPTVDLPINVTSIS
jgi:hypothetical protein